MGNSASKAAKTAAQTSKRQYPTRIPPISATNSLQTPTPKPQGPQVHSPEQASGTRTEAINRDSFDPQFGAALRAIGPVQPSPTQSNSSTAQNQLATDHGAGNTQPIFPDPRNNPALLVLEARKKLSEQAEAEIEQYGRKEFQGKRFLDVITIRQILAMRDQQGMTETDIERQLELHPGSLAKLAKGKFFIPDRDSHKPIRR